jgi:aryl-alcohol dehydrogenase-like predicted oxidoreductase
MQGTPFHHGVLLWPKQEWVENPPDWMTVEEHGKYVRLLQIQKDSGLSLPELAIGFILSNETVSTAIPGTANVDQLEANVAAAESGPLPEDIQALIESPETLHDDPRRYY